jgi:adenosylmethionine---8-amino-7-oxononanoate aminotransferase
MKPIKTNAEAAARSAAAIWHPCTQMKQLERFPLIPIARGEGVWLFDYEGKRLLDGVSSWWTNLFGHANPHINSALITQLNTLEHAMLAGFTHQPAIDLAERLSALTGLGHAFFASDGASATEIALKMSFHAHRNNGDVKKQKFIMLDGAYHGETIGALAVSDVAIFKDAYGNLLNKNFIVEGPSFIDAPHGTEKHNGCCSECVPAANARLDLLLQEHHEEIAALIIEPLLQGANGMRFMPAAYLHHARAATAKYNVHLICDEIMTGFGRTGTLFAHEQANIKPDLLCLSKGITAGYLPLSCVLSCDAIYAAFYEDETAKGFLHSHSYTGNALACVAALASLAIFATDDILAKNTEKAVRFNQIAAPLAQHPHITNFRHIGMIWAFDIIAEYANEAAFGKHFFTRAMTQGVILRPIGNTVYFMPPYIIDDAQFQLMVDACLNVMNELSATH